MIMAANPRPFCRPCKLIFQPQIEIDSGSHAFKKHHTDKASLLDAVKEKCYTCCIFWKNLPAEVQDWWNSDSRYAQATVFRTYSEKDCPSLIKLELAAEGFTQLPMSKIATKFRVMTSFGRYRTATAVYQC